ncbi:MAG: endonuclease MutS2 [Spirochaetales bacterium]
MDKKTLEQLDYFRIRDTVAGFCISEEGRHALLKRTPFIIKSDTDIAKKEASEWTQYIQSGGVPILHTWNQISMLFSVLAVDGTVLDIENVYALGQFCRSVLSIQKAFCDNTVAVNNAENLFLPTLTKSAENLPDLHSAETEIFKIIDNSGTMRELPSIKKIQSTIRSVRSSIDYLIKKYTTDTHLQDALQSNIPVLRSDRQVLAVKANYRGRFKGIVHEVSQTGQTIYLEPEDVVQKNNELVQEQFHLAQEIRNILRTLTARLAEYKNDFEHALEIMIRFDCSHAVARWGIEQKCTFALDCTKTAHLLLLQARHPLLATKAVPIDIEFREAYKILIITGPNTGGKTVSLKTTALFAMLNQSGFPIPAAEGSRLPFFTSIFADIGDEQSLDQSLSTFSGHMKNIGEMLEKATENSLILLDELGSGTDPQEGAAIAMAVLDRLIQKNAFVLVTTHHGVLKNYGYTHPTCINASVEFNEHTLKPTYRILMGVPGESHALDIAQKNGLAEKTVQEARKYIENNQADVTSLIQGLNKKYEELAQIESDIKKKEEYTNEKRRKVDLKELKLRQRERELKDGEYRNAKVFFEENRRMLENLVRELREGEITREKTLKVKQTIEKLAQDVENEKKSLNNATQLLSQSKQAYDAYFEDENTAKNKTQTLQNTGKTLKKGTDVFVHSAKSRGVIIGKAKNLSWLVQVGSLKITVKEDDISIAAPTQFSPSVVIEMARDNTGNNKKSHGNNAERPQFELRLLGMHAEEAIKALERQLDLCVLYDFHEFSVIHGKGNGILQQRVHDYLSHYEGVKDFSFAPPEAGGTGKTYVKL